MIGYILTTAQKNIIQDQEYAPFEHFNCVLDINGIWFTLFTPEQETIILNTEYSWVLGLPEAEYVPPIYVPPFI